MPMEQGPAEMFTLLNADTVRMQLPALPIAGRAEPMQIHIDFDVAAVEEMLEHLAVLRSQMLPAPLRN